MTGGAPPGFNSMAEYLAAVERETDRMTATGDYAPRGPGKRSEPKRQQGPSRTQGAISGPFRGEGDYDTEGFKLVGKAGSPERLQQLRERYPEMYPELDKELEAENLSKLLTAYLDNPGQHEQVAAQTARMIVAIDDPGVLDQVREALDGSPILERVEDHVASAVQQQIDRHEQETREERQAALAAQQRKIQSELDRLHPTDAEFVLNAIPAEELYEMSEEEAALQMRTVAELSASQRKALGDFEVVAPIVEELKRYGGQMNDEERERYEAGLEAGLMSDFDRTLVGPEEAADRAVNSMLSERSPDPFLKELGTEMDKLSKTDEQIDQEVELENHLLSYQVSDAER